MKYIYNLTLTVFTLFFIGCAGNEPIVKGMSENYVFISGTHSLSDGDVSEVNNLAIFINEAATMFKEENIKYFYIKNKEISPVITNFDNLVSYCYPDNDGYTASDFGDKSTNLERKCLYFQELLTNGTVYWQNENKIVIGLVGLKEADTNRPTWVVEDVLNDPLIKKYIESAIKESGYNPKFKDDFSKSYRTYFGGYSLRKKYSPSLF